jgi:D-alanyl-D-alanine carboxypeptidase
MKYLFSITILLGITISAYAMPDTLQPISLQAVNQTILRHVEDSNFYGVTLVAEEGVIISQQASSHPTEEQGFAYDLFPIASITKLFTSIVVLQLHEEGKLQLDDPIQKWFPELEIPTTHPVTVHHLLLHISGLPNEKDRSYLKQLSPMEMVEKAFNNKMNTFGAFNYNNVDYLLLGLIIERITGNSWQSEVRTKILAPLEMNSTGFLAKDALPSGIALGYQLRNNGEYAADRAIYWENFYAAGCMYSNAGDLLKLDQALYGEELLLAASKSLLSTSYPEYNYVGYGVWNYQYPFVETFPFIMERRGGIQGINVVLVRLIESNRTIIILSNTDQFNPDSFGDPTNLREELIKLCAAPATD